MNPLFFDPNPLFEYNFDYNAGGTNSGVFTWYDPAKTGIFYSISGVVNQVSYPVPSSGTPLAGANLTVPPDCLSVSYSTFPTYNFAGLEYDKIIYTYNSSFAAINNFAGQYPRFVNFQAMGATGVSCLYQKSGDIFYRNSSESFSTERKLTNRGDILRPALVTVSASGYSEFYFVRNNYDSVVIKMKK